MEVLPGISAMCRDASGKPLWDRDHEQRANEQGWGIEAALDSDGTHLFSYIVRHGRHFAGPAEATDYVNRMAASGDALCLWALECCAWEAPE